MSLRRFFALFSPFDCDDIGALISQRRPFLPLVGGAASHFVNFVIKVTLLKKSFPRLLKAHQKNKNKTKTMSKGS